MVVLESIIGAIAFTVGAAGTWFFTKPSVNEKSEHKTETAVTNNIELQSRDKEPDTLMMAIVIILFILGVLRVFELCYFIYKRHYSNLKKRLTVRNVNNNNINTEQV